MNRVTKDTPCPICQRVDWCGLSDDGSIAICMREHKNSIGIAKNGGYIHLLKERAPADRTRTKTIKIKPRVEDDFKYRKLNGLLRNAVDETAFNVFARSLGLSLYSLHRLQVGWCNCLKVWSFPMFNPDGRITGFRLRTSQGKKFSMTGGRESLFLPRDLGFDNRRLLICEGPTDCGATLDLGFDAIGRPSCLGAVAMTVEFVRQNWPLDATIIADGDTPGQHGATTLSNALLGVARTVRIVTPPDNVKDIRQWKFRGAKHDDVLNLIKKTEPLELRIERNAL